MRLTLEEAIGKIDTSIPIPFRSPVPLDHQGYIHGAELLGLDKQSILCAEAHNDLWNAEEEGLDPELHELTLKVVGLAIILDHCRRLELHPVDWIALSPWFVVPY